MKEIIEVTIKLPPGEYDDRVYTDPQNCYLSRALKNMGFQSVSVGAHGKAKINGIEHHPVEQFGTSVLKRHFRNKKDIVLHLKPV